MAMVNPRTAKEFILDQRSGDTHELILNQVLSLFDLREESEIELEDLVENLMHCFKHGEEDHRRFFERALVTLSFVIPETFKMEDKSLLLLSKDMN